MSGASIRLREWASILVLLIFADIAALLATIDISPESNVVAFVVTLLLITGHRYEVTYFSISPNGNNLATETLTLTHPN